MSTITTNHGNQIYYKGLRNRTARWKYPSHRIEAKSPQTKGIVERFHKTLLSDFYRVAYRSPGASVRLNAVST